MILGNATTGKCNCIARTIDEGIEILTGTPAGEKQNEGTYPEKTVNYLVSRNLKDMANRLKDFYSDDRKEGKVA